MLTCCHSMRYVVPGSLVVMGSSLRCHQAARLLLHDLYFVLLLSLELAILIRKFRSTHLPTFHLVLLGPILLDKVVEDLLEPVGVGLELWKHFPDCALNKHSIDHSEAFSLTRQWCECLENKPDGVMLGWSSAKGHDVHTCVLPSQPRCHQSWMQSLPAFPCTANIVSANLGRTSATNISEPADSPCCLFADAAVDVAMTDAICLCGRQI